MEEVTINITEEVEEITINVFEGGTEQIQSDFEQTDETAVDFIKNKPTIPSNAAQITVSDPVTPDYTVPEVGDTMQDITNKVAGLQDNLIWEEVFVNDITQFELSQDKNGNPLNEKGVLILVDGVVSESSNLAKLQLNSITSNSYWNSVTNSIRNDSIIYCNGFKDNVFSGTIECYNNNGTIVISQAIGNSSSTTGAARTSHYTSNLVGGGNITEIKLIILQWKAGSRIKIYRL